MDKFNAEDLVDHHSVAVYVIRDGKVLSMFHKKHQMLAPVLGKQHDDESLQECAVRELQEETGLFAKAEDLILIRNYVCKYDFDGKEVEVIMHCYALYEFEGEPFNKEPDKHDVLTWKTYGDIELDYRKKADAFKVLLSAFKFNRGLDEFVTYRQALGRSINSLRRSLGDEKIPLLALDINSDLVFYSRRNVDKSIEIGWRYHNGDGLFAVKWSADGSVDDAVSQATNRYSLKRALGMMKKVRAFCFA